ncbi:MAG TPA: efflux RND transporter periplasmic adaptor subunit [Bacteroidota bacterium]|nr:efflux RND transporter periplasmic adaptor subunit [Bacteroidota bacterium]
MKKRLNIVLIPSALIIALVCASCGGGNAKENSASPSNTQAANIKVSEVRPSVFEDAISATGIVKAYDDVKISPEEGGVVKEWKVKKGSYVKAGTVLGTLKDDLLQAGYDAANAQYRLAELNFEKQKSVYGEQGISELQMKSSEYNRDAAKAAADAARARLEHARITSPISGVFDNYFAEAGEMAPPGVPIAHVVNASAVKINVDIPERHAADIRQGTRVFITPDIYPNDTLQGSVSFIGATISQSNRTLPVEITLSNPGMKLKPEMVTRVRLIRSIKPHAILVDESLVQQADRNKKVVFVERNGKAEERVVRTGGRRGAEIEIVDGLSAGDRLVTVGYNKLVNGQQVQVTR